MINWKPFSDAPKDEGVELLVTAIGTRGRYYDVVKCRGGRFYAFDQIADSYNLESSNHDFYADLKPPTP